MAAHLAAHVVAWQLVLGSAYRLPPGGCPPTRRNGKGTATEPEAPGAVYVLPHTSATAKPCAVLLLHCYLKQSRKAPQGGSVIPRSCCRKVSRKFLKGRSLEIQRAGLPDLKDVLLHHAARPWGGDAIFPPSHWNGVEGGRWYSRWCLTWSGWRPVESRRYNLSAVMSSSTPNLCNGRNGGLGNGFHQSGICSPINTGETPG
jgi:hypothetical protein